MRTMRIGIMRSGLFSLVISFNNRFFKMSDAYYTAAIQAPEKCCTRRMVHAYKEKHDDGSCCSARNAACDSMQRA